MTDNDLNESEVRVGKMKDAGAARSLGEVVSNRFRDDDDRRQMNREEKQRGVRNETGGRENTG